MIETLKLWWQDRAPRERVLLAIMGAQIVFRYGFNSSLIWAEETCRYLLIWVSFLGIALAYERGEIAAIDLLRDPLPPRAGLALAAIVNLLGAILCGVLAFYGYRYASLAGGQPIPALRFLLTDTFGAGASALAPRFFWVYAALPLGMAILGIRLLIDVATYASLMKSGGRAADIRLAGTPEADA